MVLYFSCTGNSEYIAKVIGAKLDEVPINIFNSVKNNVAEHYDSQTPYVFVLPVHNMRIPEKVEEFLSRCSFDSSEEFALCLVGSYSVGNSARRIKNILTSQGLHHIATVPFYMQSSNVLGLAKPNLKRTLKYADRAGKEAELFAQRILNCKPSMPLTVSLVGTIGTSLYPLIKKLKRDTSFKINNNCISCGKCADACFNNNIQLVDNKPDWLHNCTHCGACISSCPQNAIEYGHKKGHVGYRFPSDYTEHTRSTTTEENTDPLFSPLPHEDTSQQKEDNTTQE